VKTFKGFGMEFVVRLGRLTILFYGKTSKTTKEGLLPIYLRVTINGKRFEVSTGRYLDASRWPAASERAKGFWIVVAVMPVIFELAEPWLTERHLVSLHIGRLLRILKSYRQC